MIKCYDYVSFNSQQTMWRVVFKYTVTEPEPSWSDIAQGHDWPLGYAELLKEIGAILVLVMAYVTKFSCYACTLRRLDW